MTKFICTSCNFRFESEKMICCPYCNSNNIERDKNAKEIIDEVTRIIEEKD